MQGRLIPEIKHITVLEFNVATLDEIKEQNFIPGGQRKDHLYVIRLKKGKKDAKLFLAPVWPKRYNALVQEQKVDDLIGVKDHQELLECKKDQKHILPSESPTSLPAISAQTFSFYGNMLNQHCRQKIEENAPKKGDAFSIDTLVGSDGENDEATNLFPQSPRTSNFAQTQTQSSPSDSAQQQAIFSPEEEKQITDFFGNDLIDSLNKIQAAFSKQHKADVEEKRSEQQYPGETELEQLIDALKKKTPKTPMTKEEAGEDTGVLQIAATAQALKEKLGLTLGWWAWKQVLRLIECITQAAPGAWAGAKVGAAAGTAAGVGVGSIPAATVGTVAGGILGGGFTLWVGHKAGAGHWLSHLSTTIAQADHSATADTAITSKMKKKA